MRKTEAAAAILALALLGAATVSHAANHSRVIEAYAETPFDKSQPLRISPLDAKQAHEPVFQELAGELYDRLSEQGFRVVRPKQPSDFVVTLEYQTLNTNLRASTESSVNDPSYRMVIVTAWDVRDPAHPKLRWQTATDDYGISMDFLKVVPAMLKVAAPSFGAAKTPLGLNKALWCADGVPTLGHRIAPVCGPGAERPQENQAAKLLGLTSFQSPAPGG